MSEFVIGIAKEVGLTILAIVVLPYLVSILKSVRDDKRLKKILDLVQWAVVKAEEYAKDEVIDFDNRETYARDLIEKYRDTYQIKRKWIPSKVVDFAISKALDRLEPTFKDEKEKKEKTSFTDKEDKLGDL